MREKLPIPKRIQEAPDLQTGLELYYAAFFRLCTCRPVGFDITEIPWTAIQNYCEAIGLDEEQTEDMFYFIPKMDQAYLEFIRSKRNNK